MPSRTIHKNWKFMIGMTTCAGAIESALTRKYRPANSNAE
jgi:hypothetical protein